MGKIIDIKPLVKKTKHEIFKLREKTKKKQRLHFFSSPEKRE